MRDSKNDTTGAEGLEAWPVLPNQDWAGTLETLHMCSQIVGKIRMKLSPWVNHSWSVALYVTPRGLTTSSVPCAGGALEMTFDFPNHALSIEVSSGETRSVDLLSTTVARFYQETLSALRSVGIEVAINPRPCEISDPIPFHQDDVHGEYNTDHASALHQALVNAARVMGDFRSRFVGKVSPVHLFWGAFDLAVTRFSGRRAPEHPGGIPNLSDAVTREAYSHEVSSCGLWFGNRDAPDPVFYAYAYPTPTGFSEAPVQPEGAVWVQDLGEFVLPYDQVRTAPSPEGTLERFFQSTYEASADLAGWDRENLEWADGYRPV